MKGSNQGDRRSRTMFGPAVLVTAAFIGPGTVITASRAGTQFGCELLWVVVVASVGTIVLQSLAARLGIATGKGLSEAIRKSLQQSVWLRPAIGLVIFAIGFGNAAYQTGNLTGAVVGLESFVGGSSKLWVLVLAVMVALLLGIGKDRLLQSVLVVLVCLLSLAFLVAAAVALPSWDRIASGLLYPSVTLENLSIVVALMGTTIVPYNLFLHASRSASAWTGMSREEALRASNTDTVLSISVGGLVTASILLTACGAFYDQGLSWDKPSEIASQLRPTFGSLSEVGFAMGLFAAGLTSSITAPIATGYAVCGCMGWTVDSSGKAFRLVSLSVVVVGAACAIGLDGSPTATIIAAQIANGILLPIVGMFLLFAAQRQAVSRGAILAAWCVVIPIAALGVWRVVSGVLRIL